MVNIRQLKKRGINAMKSIFSLFSQHRIASIIMLVVFILFIMVVMVNQKSEPNPSHTQSVVEQLTKMDKFKSGTYKLAKEIGY